MADDQDDAQKTEEPTPKRMQEARKRGQVPLSKETNNWFILLVGTLIIAFLFGPIFTEIYIVLKTYIEQAHLFPSERGGIGTALSEGSKHVLMALSLPVIAMIFIAVAAPLSQIGPLFSPEAIQPKFSKVSPLAGAKRLFSMRSVMELAKGLVKLGAVGGIGLIIILPYLGGMEHMIDLPMIDVLQEMQAIVVKMMIGILIVFLIIAAADLIFQRYQNNKQLKMTRQEVRDEYKQSEGDPHVKSKLRGLRMEKARQRMMQAVPEASVVITNPTHFAIALKYIPEEMNAPICVAKGTDELALRIREVAKENNVEIVENKPLARSLYDIIDIDDTIPAEHFKAVAEIISYVFKKQGKSLKKN